jgi:hypothetical protein
MEEPAFCGVIVAVVMVGVPLWHSIREGRQGRVVKLHLARWWLACALVLVVSLIMAILLGYSAFLLSTIPPAKLSLLSTSCKIISKGVDLRSAKVCELKYVAHMPTISSSGHTGRSKLRCYFDYYWTSVFKVEFRPHFSEAAVEAAAESPAEVLPIDCRPDFHTVWRTKERFQINEDYPCKYNPSNLQRVELVQNFTGNCTVEEPPMTTISRHFWTLFAHHTDIFSISSKNGHIFWRTLTSISLGFCYSIFVTGVTKTACHLRFGIFETEEFTDIDVLYFEARLQAMLLFMACMLTLVWLGSDYEDQIDAGIQLLIAAVKRTLQ